jgi:hypothetical protein
VCVSGLVPLAGGASPNPLELLARGKATIKQGLTLPLITGARSQKDSDCCEANVSWAC